jgi:phosphoglycolate phosphatase
VRAVAFDLDGTLVDSTADIASAANHCLRAAGLPARSIAEIRGCIGDGSRVLLARAAGFDPSDARLDSMLQRFLDFYTEHAVVETRLLDAALEVLDALNDLPLALCTNKPRITTDAVLQRLGVAPRFAAVVAAGDAAFHKPHAAPLERVAELLGLPASQLVLVGDGPQDVACARAAGARSIGISEALIVPLDQLRAARPDALVPLARVPRVIAGWRAGE